MTNHLLAISIGPVQEFIAAARRTRDLWFGSHLLSDISRAVAETVKSEGGQLIFPSAQDVGGRDAAVANVILAELSSHIAPRELADTAKQAAQNCWLAWAKRAHQEALGAGPALLREDLWLSQLDDVIEYYAAWVPRNGDYKMSRQRLMRLLAGRKACRNFEQPQGDVDRRGVLKSSLDGRRESVLQKKIVRKVPGRLPLTAGEQLCAVGLTKREAGGKRPYPSVARIAADPWLRGVTDAARRDDKIAAAFDDLKQVCGSLRDGGSLHALDPVRFSQFKAFLYEGTSVYPSRYDAWKQESGLRDADLEPLRKALENLGKLDLGDPNPYLAILAADGDRMGELLSTMEIEAHREFSASLAGFAKQAYDIAQKHFGVCVFAGGDDVLAFLPVDQCLKCARTLHEEFANLKHALRNGHEPTLSVGIAIGHFMEPLEDLRAWGLEAEKFAKGATPNANQASPFAERNGLAVSVYPRSGVSFGVREQWYGADVSLDMRLQDWADRFAEGDLPGKLPYDLRTLARELGSWPLPGAPPEAVEAETRLLLKRKQVTKEVRAKLAGKLSHYASAAALLRLAQEMLVAQWIAAAQRQAGSRASKEDRP